MIALFDKKIQYLEFNRKWTKPKANRGTTAAKVEFKPQISSPGFSQSQLHFAAKCNANCDWSDVPGEYPGEDI